MIHFRRYIGSLVVVLTMLAAYALFIAPWLEPPPVVRRADVTVTPASLGTATARVDFKQLFPPGSWELDQPKVVETEQCTLLIKDYQPTPDGRLELKPCTLIFYSGGDASSGGPAKTGKREAKQRPIVLQAPAGAVLQFDKALDLTQAQFGRLLGGKLTGEITITSPPSRLGANDALKLVTRNVQIDRERVFTPHDVDFTYGASFGRGRDLSIALLPSDEVDAAGGTGIGGVRSLTLARIERLHLQTGGMGLMPESPEKKGRPSDSPQPPLEVTCRGPLVYDVEQQVAMLDDRVEVFRVNAAGPPDRLACQRLLLYFAEELEPQVGATTKALAPPPANDAMAGRLKRLVALGSPVTLDAPSQGAFASAARLEYSLSKRRLILIPGRNVTQVSLGRQPHEIVARELEYEAGAAGGLGRLWAAGPGQLKMVQSLKGESKPAQRTLVARWEKELRIRPDGPNQLISLVDKASVDVDPLGRFSADALHLWVTEIPQPVNQSDDVDKTKLREPKVTIQPDRLLALGTVQIASPKLDAESARIEAWFVNQPEMPKTTGTKSKAASPATGPTGLAHETTRPPKDPLPPSADSSVAAPMEPEAKPVSLQKFRVAGELIQLQVVLAGREAQVEDLTIRNGVTFDEVRTPEPGQIPIHISGDLMQLRRGTSPEATIDVTGQPAEVTGRGMSLAGGTIHVEQGQNRLWIDGPGEASLPMPEQPLAVNLTPGIPMPAAPKGPPQKVHVVWHDGLTFDGLTARVAGDVSARTATQLTRSASLDATLAQRIDFLSPRGSQSADLAQLHFDGGVYVRNEGLDATGKRLSLDQAQLVNFTFDRARGTLHADGPGWVSSTRSGEAAIPGVPARPQSTQPKPAMPGGVADAVPLNFVHISFEGAINGNLERREINFEREVRTIYAPVQDWEQRIVIDRIEDLRERDIFMTSDRLTVNEMVLPGGETWIETMASGDTVVEGSKFTVNAPLVKYSSDKQVLTLEGNGYADARLFYRSAPGQQFSDGAARKYTYWLRTGTLELQDSKGFNINGFNAGGLKLPGTRPKGGKR